MRRPVGGVHTVLVALLIVSGCGGDSATGATGVFQLAAVTTSSLVIQCGTNPISHITSAAPESLYFYVHLVNTTGDDVSVTSVGSVGTVIRASDPSVVGQGANNFVSIDFRPQPVLVRAHDGDVTMTVVLPATPLCVQPATVVLQYKDATTSVRVYTTAGLFISPPLTLHMNYVGGSVRE